MGKPTKTKNWFKEEWGKVLKVLVGVKQLLARWGIRLITIKWSL